MQNGTPAKRLAFLKQLWQVLLSFQSMFGSDVSESGKRFFLNRLVDALHYRDQSKITSHIVYMYYYLITKLYRQSKNTSTQSKFSCFWELLRIRSHVLFFFFCLQRCFASVWNPSDMIHISNLGITFSQNT